MAEGILSARMAAEIEGDFVVFLIGMRINRLWKVHKWWPAAMAMPKMQRELAALPREETGFLGQRALGLGASVQYWRSFEHLEAYARAADRAHMPAWAEFNRRMKASRGDVGIWHETYLVKAGQYEAVYSGMPPVGLGKAGRLVPATGRREAARARLQG